MKRLLLIATVGLAGCSDSSSKATPPQRCTPDAVTGMALTSSSFASCGEIPIVNTCATANNASPPLAWTGAPADTKSFAVVMRDLSLDPPLIHWVLYDIPATTTSLPDAVMTAYAPANVPGAHQTASYQPDARGYLGPCPGDTHTYQFEVHALRMAVLPAGEDTTSDEALDWITDNTIASATLTATYSP